MNTTSRKLALASAGSLLLAIILLVCVVLPAEYGWDPLGSGKALGLVGLSGNDSNPLVSQPEVPHSDRIQFQLQPFEAVEYKYQLNAGAVLIYQWQADGEVLFDMHSEPEGAAPGYAETFAKSRARADQGSYTAPFSGIHGWFFQNRGEAEITVSLETTGFYPWAKEFRDGREQRREF
jgi:hypothetical protein